jgi:CRISP-associated protein Cas1
MAATKRDQRARTFLADLPENVVQKIVELRKSGNSFRAISAEAGLSHGSCGRVYKNAVNGAALGNALAIPKRARLGSSEKPDFEKVDEAVSQGADVKSVWRDYARQSQRAYCYTHFSQLFRAWLKERQKSAAVNTGELPRHSVAEFTAARDYWQDRIDPRSDVLALGDRCQLKIERGDLVVWNGNSERRFPKVVHGLKTIVFTGFGGTLSFQVIKWCELQGIGICTLGWYGEFIGITGTHLTATVDLRRAQFRADGFTVARNILEQKLLSEAKIGKLSKTAHAKALARMKAARCTGDLFPIEAEAALAYWQSWAFDLHFAARHWPAQWERFEHRASAISGGGRHATHPVNAILNYAYSVAAAQLTRALAAHGFDPACGFMHADAAGRASLTYDALELLRADVDAAILPWAASHKWKRADFPVTPEGIVRLQTALAAVIAQRTSAAITQRDLDRVCAWFEDAIRRV